MELGGCISSGATTNDVKPKPELYAEKFLFDASHRVKFSIDNRK